jgi:HNH endonuclease
LGARLRTLCVEIDPDDAKTRYQDALAERRVFREATGSGTANLFLLDVAPDRVASAYKHIDRLAKSLKTKDEPRGINQIRADVALDLLCGKPSATGSSGGAINIHVDLATLAELDDKPGELGGFGPVIADIARQVTARQGSSQWKWTLSHHETGMFLDNGITRRRPNAAQQRRIEAERPTCAFPGCRMPADECDIDHLRAYSEGGPTEVANLVPGCRHDHVDYTKHGWIHRHLPNGDHLWISPLGHRYTTSGLPPPDELPPEDPPLPDPPPTAEIPPDTD